MHLSNNLFCRLCAGSFDRSLLTIIHSNTAREQKLDVMIKQYMPFQRNELKLTCDTWVENNHQFPSNESFKFISTEILLDDSLPQSVCDSCKMNLKLWHTFVSSCEEAQKKLQQLCKRSSSEDVVPLKTEDVSCSVEGAQVVHPSVCAIQPLPSPRIVLPSSSVLKKKKSSNYCVARWCNTGNYQGVSLFRFPKDKSRALSWLIAAERTDLKTAAYLHCYYLCANHFAPNMFTNRACNQLMRKAVPTIFPRPAYADKMALKAAVAKVLPTQLQGIQLKRILPKASSGSKSDEDRGQKSSSQSQQTDSRSVAPSSVHTFHTLGTPVQPNEDPSTILQLISCSTSSGHDSAESIVSNSMVHVRQPSRNTTTTMTSKHVSPIVNLINSANNVIHVENSPDQSLQLYSVEGGSTVQLFSVARDGSAQEQNSVASNLPLHFVRNIDDSVINLFTLPQADASAACNEQTIVRDVCTTETDVNTVEVLSRDQPSCSDLGQSCNERMEENSVSESLKAALPDSTGSIDMETLYPGSSEIMLNVANNFDDLKKQTLDMRFQFQNRTVSTAQDLLLPHSVDRVEKTGSSFQEQAHNLSCDLSQDSSHIEGQVADLNVIADHGTVLNQGEIQENAHSIMFGLHSDDTQESCVYSNHIECLDELMDLDHIFGNR